MQRKYEFLSKNKNKLFKMLFFLSVTDDRKARTSLRQKKAYWLLRWIADCWLQYIRINVKICQSNRFAKKRAEAIFGGKKQKKQNKTKQNKTKQKKKTPPPNTYWNTTLLQVNW